MQWMDKAHTNWLDLKRSIDEKQYVEILWVFFKVPSIIALAQCWQNYSNRFSTRQILQITYIQPGHMTIVFSSILLHHLLSDGTLAKSIKNIRSSAHSKIRSKLVFLCKRKPGKDLKLKCLMSGLFDIAKSRERWKLHAKS